jgi:hypothetical protein
MCCLTVTLFVNELKLKYCISFNFMYLYRADWTLVCRCTGSNKLPSYDWNGSESLFSVTSFSLETLAYILWDKCNRPSVVCRVRHEVWQIYEQQFCQESGCMSACNKIKLLYRTKRNGKQLIYRNIRLLVCTVYWNIAQLHLLIKRSSF